MNEFDGTPLVIGAVRGVRSFTADPDGTLRGPQMNSPWQPGENEAGCLLQSILTTTLNARLRGLPGVVVINSTPALWDQHTQQWVLQPDPKHSMATCKCGFYAYHDGSDDYRADATISAVIEGYGDVMLGTRGFRAEKARILALCIPRSRQTPRRRPASRWWIYWALLAAGNFAAGASVTLIRGSWWGLLNLAAAVGSTWISWWHAYGRRKYLEPAFAPLTAVTATAVRQRYPDVPVFTTFEAMVAAYPPHAGRSVDAKPDRKQDAA